MKQLLNLNNSNMKAKLLHTMIIGAIIPLTLASALSLFNNEKNWIVGKNNSCMVHSVMYPHIKMLTPSDKNDTIIDNANVPRIELDYIIRKAIRTVVIPNLQQENLPYDLIYVSIYKKSNDTIVAVEATDSENISRKKGFWPYSFKQQMLGIDSIDGRKVALLKKHRFYVGEDICDNFYDKTSDSISICYDSKENALLVKDGTAFWHFKFINRKTLKLLRRVLYW